MSEMIDRVAAAIAQAMEDGAVVNGVFCEHLARAAIEAMREPTDPMLKALGSSGDYFGGETEHRYNRMIDEALA